MRVTIMDFISLITELFTNADHFLVTLATDYGAAVYAVMFLIYFLETGVVVCSFLPGDSLLFVAGTVAAAGTMNPLGLMLREHPGLSHRPLARQPHLRRLNKMD